MERSCWITFITLFLTIAKVYGQACPEGNNVVQMCVPGSYSGESVLIDTASYNPSTSNCSCTFGTTSSIIKLVTYVAPNYPECNSAVRLYSSSGNSIRFQCLMSGTYLDTSVHNAGVATFEKYGDIYDKNYCLMLEIAGRIGDIVTVTCTGDEATAQNSIVTDVVNDTIDTLNDTVNTANNTNDNTTDNSAGTTTSLPLAELSTIDTPSAKTETRVEASKKETTSNTTSTNKTENKYDLSNMDVTTKDIVAHRNTETSKTEILTTAIPLLVTTLNSSDGQILESNVTDSSQLKQEMNFTNSGFDNLNASYAPDIVSVGKTYNTTNDTLESLEGAETYRREDRNPIDTVTAIVTGTVLFNGGGTNSSKTIQTIGAVLSDSLPVQSHETPMETTTSKIEYYVSSSSWNIKPTQEISEFLLPDLPVITQPTDVSNLLVMENNSSKSKSEMTGAESNKTDTRGLDYSLQFPRFDPLLSLPSENDTSNMTVVKLSEMITAFTGINESLSMKSNVVASMFMNSSATNITDTIPENNTLFNEPLEANGHSLTMASPDAQRITSGDVTSQVNITVGVQNKSHFTTREMRFVMENTEPTDVVGNKTIRSIMPTENTTEGNVAVRSILQNESSTNKMARDFSVSSVEGNQRAKSTGVMGMSLFVTESPDFTKTTLGTELKAMEMSSFVTESPDFSKTTDFQSTDPFSTNLVKNNVFTVFEQTTPVSGSNENFTNEQSMYESTGKSDLSHNTKISASTEGMIVNQTVGNEISSNYAQSMFESTGKSDLSDTTKLSENTEEIIINPTLVNEEIMFNRTAVNRVSSSHIPTTPSSLDLVYLESSVSTVSNTNVAHSKITSPVPTTTDLNTSKAILFEENNSFVTSSYHIPEQNSTDPTASASINESLNLTETMYEVVPGDNTFIDDVSRILNSNVSFSDASLTEVLSPSMNETNINFLSSIQRINSPNLNLNESIFQPKTQRPYDSSLMPNDDATVSELNNTQVIPDTARNLPYEEQESANLSLGITSEASSTVGERNINHTDRVPLSDMNFTEYSSEIKDHLSFVHNERVPLSPTNETEVTQGITTILTDINTNEGMQENTRMSFNQRERLPSADIKSTGSWQDITPTYTDQMVFVHRDNVPLTDKISIVGRQETSTKRTDQTLFVQRENLPSANTESPSGWQELTTQYNDRMALVHRDSVSLTDIKSTEAMQETTTQNIDQMSFVQRHSLSSADIKSTGGLQESTTSYIEQTPFVHRDSKALADIKSTGRLQEITTNKTEQMSFIQPDTVPSANIKATEEWQELTTQSMDQMSDVYRENVPFAGNKAFAISQEITTQNIKQVPLYQREYVNLADINSTEIAPESALKSGDNASDFNSENFPVSDPNVVEVSFDITTESVESTPLSARRSTSIRDSIAAQNINETVLGTSATEQPKVTTKTTNVYIFESGIDQHNILDMNEARPNTYNDTTDKLVVQDMFSQTTKDMQVSTMNPILVDQTSSKDSIRTSTGPSSTPTASLADPMVIEFTSNIPEIGTAAPTKIIPTIAEEVIVHEKINKEEIIAHENVVQEKATSKTLTSISTESYVLSDILAGIENQIITETKSKQTPIGIKSTIRSNSVELSTAAAKELLAKDVKHSTKYPDFTTTSTTRVSKTVIRNEDLHPENIHPEPISPRLPLHTDNHMNIPTTTAKSFHTIEETDEVSAEINSINDGAKINSAGENGMNVYFDTGSSKNSPFEMNNDTYIIVVGAIVGLVVLAVVIGILCHNSRKTRSEKVNISGEVDPSSHQNQAFDSEAADAEQGASSNGIAHDSSVPAENGGSCDTSEKEHNGNVES